MPAHGALVAVPNRHVLVVHPIASVEAVRALNAMIILADRLYREGPGAIVPHVYWWRSGEPPMRIPSSVDEKRVTPPDELVTVLNELAQR
jgi:hypothetical protein